jgi:broad specificity phosphatase PhoE
MRVYFVRHGESEANLANVHQDARPKLSERGREQAKFLGKRVSKLPIDFIYSSTMARAKETAEIINSVINKPIEFTDLLGETLGPSELFGKKADDSIAVEIMKIRDEHREESDWKYSDEETFNERIARADKLLIKLEDSGHDNILVVTHGTFIKYLISLMIFGREVTKTEHNKLRRFFWSTNTGITICEFHEDEWNLLTFNDIAHLAE